MPELNLMCAETDAPRRLASPSSAASVFICETLAVSAYFTMAGISSGKGSTSTRISLSIPARRSFTPSSASATERIGEIRRARSHIRVAVPVGVRLDDGVETRPAFQPRFDVLCVVPQYVKIDYRFVQHIFIICGEVILR